MQNLRVPLSRILGAEDDSDSRALLSIECRRRADACTGSHYLFLTSKERDIETGLDYFLARYYSSTSGRFTSPDPIFISDEQTYNPQLWNLYNYVGNNPLNATDPTGMKLIRLGAGGQSRTRQASKMSGLQLSYGNPFGSVSERFLKPADAWQSTPNPLSLTRFFNKFAC